MPAGKASDPPTSRSRRSSKARGSLSRDDWIAEARRVLESRGVNDVKVDQLARKLGVTRGSFYFHFTHRKELLDALLEEWRRSNCEPFERFRHQEALFGPALYEAVTDLWLPTGTFRPELDIAVREWGKVSKLVAASVQEADAVRISLLVTALNDMGFDRDEAVVRARISYFHQIGYISVQFREPLKERLRYVPLYLKVLTGLDGWRERGVPGKRRKSAVPADKP